MLQLLHCCTAEVLLLESLLLTLQPLLAIVMAQRCCKPQVTVVASLSTALSRTAAGSAPLPWNSLMLN